MKSRCVHQRIVTSHRSQVSTKTCPGKGSIRFYQALASVHSNHVSSTCEGIEQTHRHVERETCLLSSRSTTVSASPGRAGSMRVQ
jgi:DnaJ-class molecular chaperone